VRLVRHAADRGPSGVDLALGQPQLRKPGVWLAAPPTGLAVGLLGLGELSAQAVQLALQVEPCAGRRLLWSLYEPLARLPRGIDGIGPCALQVHDLGAVDQALTAVEHHLGLRLAPPGQRRRPLARPAQVEALLACGDRRAVHEPGNDRRDLIGHDRDHGLVEHGQSVGDPALPDQGVTLDQAGEGHEIDVAEALTDLRRLAGDGVAGRQVSLDHAQPRGRHE
jgi:hypothetical protein